jgi:hypothetical protein
MSAPQRTQKKQNIVTVKERDYLSEDPPIRGQNFACVSFLSPEDTLRNKDAFMLHKFVGSLGKDVGNMLDSIEAKFKDHPDVIETLRSTRDRHAYMWNEEEMKEQLDHFKSVNGKDLDYEFDKSVKFATSTRGLKLRGVYDTYEQANERSKLMYDFDDKKINVFVMQVGCWCPWNPDPNAIADNEYAINELNTLMKKYNDNLSHKDDLYEKRRQERRQLMLDANEQNKNKNSGNADKLDEIDEDGKIAYDSWLKKRREASAVTDKKKASSKKKSAKASSSADDASTSASSPASASTNKKKKQQDDDDNAPDVWVERKNEGASGSGASSAPKAFAKPQTDVSAVKKKAADQKRRKNSSTKKEGDENEPGLNGEAAIENGDGKKDA